MDDVDGFKLECAPSQPQLFRLKHKGLYLNASKNGTLTLDELASEAKSASYIFEIKEYEGCETNDRYPQYEQTVTAASIRHRRTNQKELYIGLTGNTIKLIQHKAIDVNNNDAEISEDQYVILLVKKNIREFCVFATLGAEEKFLAYDLVTKRFFLKQGMSANDSQVQFLMEPCQNFSNVQRNQNGKWSKVKRIVMSKLKLIRNQERDRNQNVVQGPSSCMMSYDYTCLSDVSG